MSHSTFHKHSIPIDALHFFSNLLKDYAHDDKNIHEFYQFSPNTKGLLDASHSKSKQYQNRDLLKSIIEFNYTTDYDYAELERQNINSLLQDGLAITTAHQPNLFLGPFYIFSKAITIISLSQQLTKSLPEFHYTPIFVIGSEDHDKEELLNVTLFGKKYEWITDQEGAVGRMVVDKALVELLHTFVNTFGTSEYAEKLREVYLSSYVIGATLAEAMGSVLRKLFGKYGLIVLDIATPEVKKAMIPIFEKEMKESISLKNIQTTLDKINTNYSVQASAREINLFEFIDKKRVRIDHIEDVVLDRLHSLPELFSPNVILRPLMQQIALPSVANIGGGAEVAYWLQLKNNFNYFEVDFPVILLRDIFTVLDRKSWDKWQSLGLGLEDFFRDIDALKKNLSLKDSTLEQDIETAKKNALQLFDALKSNVASIDKSLVATVEAESIKTIKSIELIASKAIRSEKKKHEDLWISLEKINFKVFENNTLKERIENFSSFYIKYGDELIESMISQSGCLDFEFKLMVEGV